MSLFELPPEEKLPSSNPSRALGRPLDQVTDMRPSKNDLRTAHARRYYERESGRLVIRELSPARDTLGPRTCIESPSASTVTSAPSALASIDTETLKFIHGAIVRALENPTNPLIVDAALSALDDIDRHSALWANLDELLVHTDKGHGARSVEASLRKFRAQPSTSSQPHHLQLAVRSMAQTHTHWVSSPKEVPAGESPPLVLDTHGAQLPDYCLYVQAQGGVIKKAWMWTQGQGWKAVKHGDRHPAYPERVLRLERNDGHAYPSWPKESSMGSMKRLEKKKKRATTAPG
ncbi:hypothetical protein PENSPDRAFT_672112 [Peniophora sp. CONT]|nr:hypothetical protein PENSPDRAFT_672112 [Peniophora sp. CONT]